MPMSRLAGVLPAAVTPFAEEGRFHAAAFERLCDFLYAAGADGLYVCGQTGEGLQQSPEQRQRVLEVAVRCSPAGKLVMAHIGAPSTATALELARHAEQAGAQAISSLPPAGAYSFAEVRAYYAALAGAVSIPLVIYFFPGFAPVPGGLADLLSLCEIPNVAGLKFTSMDLYTLGELKRQGAVVFNGYDEIFAAGLLMGADGGIGSFYNVAPEAFASVYAAARAGDWEAARVRQAEINALIRLGLRFPVHAAVKEMLRWLGLDCGECLAPRRALLAEEKRELHEGLERLGLRKP